MGRYVDYGYDNLNRLTKKTLSTETPLISCYSYKTSNRESTKAAGDTNSYTTTQLSAEHSGKIAYFYTYDVAGNITKIQKADSNGSGNPISAWTNYRTYTYDDLCQLTSETNATTGKTYTYTYDNVGNITSKSDGTDTITYTYGTDSDAGWSKLLTSYNGQPIDYDKIGNPVLYRGANLTWTGRQLNSYNKDGTSINYTYDADGLRASKTVNDTKTTYQYLDGKLYYQETNGDDSYFYYDSYGNITAIACYPESGTSSYVLVGTNSLGDVNALYNANGDLLVKYEYDAWGNVIAETDANGNALTGSAKTWSERNPFRYRGYYYDSETQLYYLQSRYYDPEVGRFLNSDASIVIANSPLSNYDKNFYSYCDNNPINRVDNYGSSWAVLLKVGASAAIGAGSWYVSEIIENWNNGVKGTEIFIPDSSWGEFIGATVSSMMPGSGFGGALLSSLTETTIIYFERALKGERVSFGGYLRTVALSTFTGTIFEAGSDWINNKISNEILPINYSTYAGKQYKKYPGITREEIKVKLSKQGKRMSVVEYMVDAMFDVISDTFTNLIGG